MRSLRGVSLVDVVVGSALVLIIFVGLFGILRASLEIAGLVRAKAAATAIASSQLEYVRSLSYASVGTVGGIPAGIIPQVTSVQQAGTDFVLRTFVSYVDSPKDGSGAADVNHITTDYKAVRINVSYYLNGFSREVTLLSTASPPGIETTTGGGTLQIRTVDALGVAVPGATVRIQNSSTTPAIDLSAFSNIDGTVLLGGAPTSTQYRILVSKDGYSSAQTYLRDTTNQNPTPGYLTVAASQTTTGTFAIDRLATLLVRTFAPIVPGAFTDSFADATKIDSLQSVTVSGSQLALTQSGEPAAYALNGSALSTTAAPAYLATWVNASSTRSTPAGTTARIHVADGNGNLLPDAVLAGNSTGFTGVINLSAISTTTYPALSLQASLSTTNPLATPAVLDWGLGYTYGPTPLPNVSFTLTGGKTIGSTGTGAPIYKTVVATTTDETGVRELSLEWDSYQLLVPGRTIQTATPEAPYELLPASEVDASIIFTTP